jgi:hypothetical protein
MGSTLFATDDGAYRRLLPERGHTGHIGNVHVYTNADINGEVFARDRINTDDYEHIVFSLLDRSSGTDSLTIYTKQEGSAFRVPEPGESAEQTLPRADRTKPIMPLKFVMTRNRI